MLLFGQGSEKYEFASWWFGMKKKQWIGLGENL